MIPHLALLRAVNVGGKNIVPMAELRAMLEGIGMEAVQTYLQSGNAVFRAKPGDGLRARIEAAFAQRFGFAVDILVLSAGELEAIAAATPFAGTAGNMHYAFFLFGKPAPEAAAKLAVPAGEDTRFAVGDRAIYLHYGDGYGKAKFTGALIERQLGIRGTARNLNTVEALRKLMA